ncbi:hypothetical protein ACHAPK_011260 [Fusarium culmorum]
MTRFQSNDDFLIESDEPRHHITTRQEAALMKFRQQQDIIRAKLSRITNDEYLDDIMQSIREEERIVYKKDYQLLGCSALLIAAKYAVKKCQVPSFYQLYNMCDGQYDTGMFGQMEIHILRSLDWIVGKSTADFLTRLMAVVEGEEEEVADMAFYLCEIALYHHEFVSTKPSVMA